MLAAWVIMRHSLLKMMTAEELNEVPMKSVKQKHRKVCGAQATT